ncbi:carbohydrate ABC transporter permease [Paenibacillus sacheonensis]|uniref:ABC transporter permease subunit n=1 Tax=Paenibacillus sacheonensis TaxID=742054 RepID=A0A7X4YNF3_9BACL|nr:carbohydrate ABC transporter permease [Paenibacillus sacheonensis]MBM7565489.1 ABC-type glycerol-3-phosphate transport system permease component [Paenibacillus sacheonensis]NBC69583.1 ABC transporter permease subunit [Paenibacillus sacheonensis]
MSIRLTKGDMIANTIIYTILTLLVVVTLVPLLNILAISLSDSAKATAGLVTIYPLGLSWSTYTTIFKDHAILTAAGVSCQRVVLALVIDMVLVVLAAYPLSRSKKAFRSRGIYMWIVIGTMLFGPSTVPMFFTVKDMHMLGTIWALVIPGAVGQFHIILMLNYFRNIPSELEESASIDGAGPWRRLLQIYVPLSMPIMATIALFVVVGNWNAYYDGLIYSMKTSDFPLQTYIQQLVVNYDTTIRDVDQVRDLLAISNRSLTAAKLVITMIPILLVYPFMQKYFISGIMLGSVKE